MFLNVRGGGYVSKYSPLWSKMGMIFPITRNLRGRGRWTDMNTIWMCWRWDTHENPVAFWEAVGHLLWGWSSGSLLSWRWTGRNNRLAPDPKGVSSHPTENVQREKRRRPRAEKHRTSALQKNVRRKVQRITKIAGESQEGKEFWEQGSDQQFQVEVQR